MPSQKFVTWMVVIWVAMFMFGIVMPYIIIGSTGTQYSHEFWSYRFYGLNINFSLFVLLPTIIVRWVIRKIRERKIVNAEFEEVRT